MLTRTPVKTASLPVMSENITVKDEGVRDLTKGRSIDMFPIPETIDIEIESNNGVGAADTTVKIFNNTTFGDATTNNGAGAGSIVYTFGDSNSGKTYEQLFRTAQAGKGVKIFGFNFEATDSAGNALPSAITTAALKQLIADGSGGTIPINVKIQKAKRNTAQDRGLLTVKWETNFNALSQLQLLMPKNAIITINLFTTPDFE